MKNKEVRNLDGGWEVGIKVLLILIGHQIGKTIKYNQSIKNKNGKPKQHTHHHQHLYN